MAGHVHKRIVENIAASGIYRGVILVDVGFKVAVAKINQVAQRRRIGISVASPAVFQQCYLIGTRRGHRCYQCRNNKKYR